MLFTCPFTFWSGDTKANAETDGDRHNEPLKKEHRDMGRRTQTDKFKESLRDKDRERASEPEREH